MTDTQSILAQILLDYSKPDGTRNLGRLSGVKNYFIYNKNTPYKDTEESKNTLLQELCNKLDYALTKPIITKQGNRNLIYFSVFLSDDYVDLTEIALQSIVSNTPSINFDVLFITDEETKTKLLQKSVLNNFNCHFHLTSTPVSGPRASIRKLDIFDFPGIDLYQKILFLDSDLICIKDINNIFNIDISPENLYTGTNTNILPYSITTPTHGLMYLTKRDLEILVEDIYSFVPFNAGQFLFYNTERMKEHFANVRWLVTNWPGPLFFEQGCMNYYFVINKMSKILKTVTGKEIFCITNPKLTGPLSLNLLPHQPGYRPTPIVTGGTNTACPTSFQDIIKERGSEQFDAKPNDETCIVHFAGSALSGLRKIEKIKEYLDARKL